MAKSKNLSHHRIARSTSEDRIIKPKSILKGQRNDEAVVESKIKIESEPIKTGALQLANYFNVNFLINF